MIPVLVASAAFVVYLFQRVRENLQVEHRRRAARDEFEYVKSTIFGL